MFCSCSADYFQKEPNMQVCPICLGLPGALPVPNRKAIEWTIKLGLALGCKINLKSKFDRKNYFYPDLPKGYQISQYDEPFAIHGSLKVKVQSEKFKVLDEKIIRINRVHLEEDTAKLTHGVTDEGDATLIDFNRSSVPLVEIVTEPDFHGIEQVKEYLKELQKIVRYLGISDADMEKGTMRCEPSISLSTDPNKLASYRVEIKNINSFKFAERAIEYEIKRQTELLNSGVVPEQETRGYDENKGVTILQRSKENAEDYRYFPEPDIPPFIFTEEFVENLRKDIPELPAEKRKRYIEKFGLNEAEAMILTENKEIAEKFETILVESTRFAEDFTKQGKNYAKEVAKLIVNKKIDMLAVVNGLKPFTTILNEIFENLSPVKSSISDEEIESTIKKVLDSNAKPVADYKSGKTQVLGFLTGLCMKELKGKCDVKTVQEAITKILV
jgi:aspartyl-tRNA(Asn)/glutamyl-tRNA(Gln) amidotransferase subunit B